MSAALKSNGLRRMDRGAGRKRRQVFLSAATWEALRATGNASLAIERLVGGDSDGMDGGMDAATVRALRAERAARA